MTVWFWLPIAELKKCVCLSGLEELEKVVLHDLPIQETQLNQTTIESY